MVLSEDDMQEAQRIFTWEQWRSREGVTVRRMVDVILERHSGRARGEIALVLARVERELADHIREVCADSVRFAQGAMALSGETRPEECARRVLELLPAFHALVGSSFSLGLLRERKRTLEALGMRRVDVVQACAKRLLLQAIDGLKRRKN